MCIRDRLCDALLVAAALELGVEEDVHQLAGEAGADDAASHAQGVGVVVAAGCLLYTSQDAKSALPAGRALFRYTEIYLVP